MPSAPRPKPSFPTGPVPLKPWVEWVERQIAAVLGTTYTSLSAAFDALSTLIEAHASRHVHSGSDEIDGDVLDVDFTPTNYTRTTVASVTTSTQELTSHLKGIDTALASIGAVHAATHKHAGTDEIDGDLLDVDYSPTNYTSTTGANGTTSTQELTAHLKGIDTKLGTVSSAATAAQTSADTHASRHIRSGADPIDGDLIDVDYSPTNYTRSSGANGTTSTEELTSHLTGIDTTLGTTLTQAKTITYWGGQTQTNTNAGTFFLPLVFRPTVTTSETAALKAYITVERAGTLKNFRYCNSNAGGLTSTFSVTIYKEGSTTALTITGLDSTTSGIQVDNTHTVAVSAGNRICIQLVLGSGNMTAGIEPRWWVDVVET